MMQFSGLFGKVGVVYLNEMNCFGLISRHRDDYYFTKK